jgi:CRP-like cAMP-binding protein
MGHYADFFRETLHMYEIYRPDVAAFFQGHYITRLHYEPRQMFSDLFKGGGQSVVYVQDGMFKLYAGATDGKEVFTGFLPRYSTLTSMRSTGHALGKYMRANSDTTVYVAARDDFLDFLQTSKEANWALLNEPYHRRNANDLPHYETLNLSAREKVYIYILYLCIRFDTATRGQGNALTMAWPPALKDVANYSGVHPNSVSRYYNELRKRDLIEFSHKKLAIFDVDALDDLIASLQTD